MHRINRIFTLTSITVLLVTVERFSPTTAIVLPPHHFLRVHELLQMTTLILVTVLLPVFLLRIITDDFTGLHRGGAFVGFLLFITGIYFYATGNGLHEVSSFNLNQFCAQGQTSGDLCGSFFVNDYYTGNILYFVGGALMVITLMLLERSRAKHAVTRKDLITLLINACVYALAIFAYAAFDRVLVGLVYSLGVAIIADILWLQVRDRYATYPFITYTAVAYSLGTVCALVFRLH